MRVAIYLRKSRADEELEKTVGQGETLAKHKKALLKYAKDKKLNIVEIKEEIVSGESLFHRPQMLELLKEVESNMYDAVLVMDMQRLGRGDMQDQGIILKTFKDSNTKIITPQKTYDLNNDFDEEYSEFEAFMSRKELKMITRRMQSGRIRSVEDGNYIGTNPPLGYDLYSINRNRTLAINEYEAECIKLIFKLYIEGSGAGEISKHLNDLGYKTKFNREFTRSSVIAILKNQIYIGNVTWGKTEGKKSKVPGKRRDVRTKNRSEWIIAKGKHEPIIDEDTFNKAQIILESKYHVPYKIVNGPANPLAGIIICGICGSKMVLRKYGPGKAPHIICKESCGCRSSRFDYVEKATLNALEEYYNEIVFNIKNNVEDENTIVYKNQLDKLYKSLDSLSLRKSRIFEFYELGTYDTETFVERSGTVENEISSVNKQIELLTNLLNQKNDNINIASNIKNLLGLYEAAELKDKNILLKKVLIKVVYTKNKTQRNDDFKIELFPRV